MQESKILKYGYSQGKTRTMYQGVSNVQNASVCKKSALLHCLAIVQCVWDLLCLIRDVYVCGSMQRTICVFEWFPLPSNTWTVICMYIQSNRLFRQSWSQTRINFLLYELFFRTLSASVMEKSTTKTPDEWCMFACVVYSLNIFV